MQTEGADRNPPGTIAEQLERHRGTMKLSEFAALLAISYDTVYKWVRECSLPAIKIAGTYWIDPQLAARWWRDHLAVAKPPTSVRPRAAKVAHAG